jgi:hypothetical protein
VKGYLRRTAAVAVAVLGLGAFQGAAQASTTGVLDQQQTQSDTTAGSNPGFFGQSFVAGLTGGLSQVDTTITCIFPASGSTVGPLTMTVTDVDGVTLGTQTIAKPSVPACSATVQPDQVVSFVFDHRPAVTAGQSYTWAVTGEGQTNSPAQSGDAYPNGAWIAGPGSGVDLVFATYVAPQETTGTTLAVSPQPTAGRPFLLTASVTPGPAGGTVAFKNNGALINGCTAQPINPATGQASCSPSYPAPGNHTFTAAYGGNTAYGPSTSAPLQVAVGGVALSKATLLFGTVRVGATSSPQSVTVTNKTGQPVTFSSVAITGTAAPSFLRTGNTCSAGPIAPGGSCHVTVAFKPRSRGAKAAALTLTSNAPVSPQTVQLRGTGR